MKKCIPISVCFWLGACWSFALAEPARNASWRGVVIRDGGRPVAAAEISLRGASQNGVLVERTNPGGRFAFKSLPPGTYVVSLQWRGQSARLAGSLAIQEGEQLDSVLSLATTGLLTLQRTDGSGTFPSPEPSSGAASPGGADLASEPRETRASGGEHLSSKEVANLPLNKRDFSQLLLLAGGTMTDTNGSANFTQQFAVNGQRGTTAVFALDGIYTSDPEMGGATFANLNVEAIQEIRSSSGVMPAEVGAGAAGYTDVITKSGTADVHGSVFAFVRNAAFDARNFFDRRTIANPGRIPPFVRNEFGFTNGGPVVLPGIYRGRDRTHYFAQYQGFRQVLGTTQVLAVPTPQERSGINTTAFPGDTLLVPVNPAIASVLARYPLPNDPRGPYGARTYATSSKVSTVSDQFSVRLDHRISDKAQFFARFNFDNISGPTTNPAQTALDPSFAMRFFNHERNLALAYTRTISARLTSESSFGFLRTTPNYPTMNRTQPALRFADGLYESFNSPGGVVMGVFGNLFVAKQAILYVRGMHTFKMGAEARWNRDTAYYGDPPNGAYTFGGGPAYAPVAIPSASGQHDIAVGDLLPDALSGFLTATPYSWTAAVAGPQFAQGDHIGASAIRKEAYNFYFQDRWKVSPKVSLSYGLRFEVNTRFREAKHRSSHPVLIGADDRPASFWETGTRLRFLYYPDPPYAMDWRGWGPRFALTWRPAERTVFRAGGAITTILPNLWYNNFMMATIPFVFNPLVTAAPGSPVPFANAVTSFELPPVYSPDGQPVFPPGRTTTQVPANTEIDLLRFQHDLAELTPGQPVRALSALGMDWNFRNGYIGTYMAGLEREFGDFRFNASYTATVGVKLAGPVFPNGYSGADSAYARFMQFDALGNVTGGYGPVFLMATRSHSTFHSLQSGVSKTSTRAGLGFEASYTWSKSLDDASSAASGFAAGSSGTILEAGPQDPWNPGFDKGPSIFDLRHVFSISLIQDLSLHRISLLKPLGERVTSGWQLLNITTLTSGPPFSVFSGVQQTGAGQNRADRPDLIHQPVFSTSREIREDYFGRGDSNASFFYVPVGIPDGTGPNQGRFGTLGRNTFRGPAYRNLDIALIKETLLGRRGGSEAVTLQFRAEVFNVFNLVNFGLPANIVRGSGFGLINRTAGTSRQVQFSLKLLY